MQTAHLFSGAGGGLLADLILGHQPILAVEWDSHACAVLRERAAEGWFQGLHVHEGDIREFDFSPWARRVDCLAAGFPCQDISAAGRGAGITGSRSGLVSEVFRAIDETEPPIVFLENSPHIRTKGREFVIAELVARGYSWRDGVIGAADVGAGHKRDRWFCLAANADGMRKLQQEGGIGTIRRWFSDGATQATDIGGIGFGSRTGQTHPMQREEPCHGNKPAADAVCCGCETGGCDRSDLLGREERHATSVCTGNATNLVCAGLSQLGRRDVDEARQEPPPYCAETHAADHMRQRLQVAIQRGGLSETDAATIQAAAGYVGAYDWSPPDIGVCRVVDGMASRMDRIKCAGNGQVPLQAAAAWLILTGGDK